MSSTSPLTPSPTAVAGSIHDAAVAHGLELVGEGATVIDVGGESTRPYAEPVEPVEEQRRVLPVIQELAPHVRVSIDTRNAETAEAAIEAGATLVNDVSATLAKVAAGGGVGWVAMHMQGDPRTMQVAPGLRRRRRPRCATSSSSGPTRPSPSASTRCGSTRASGSARRSTHNLALLGHLDALVATGYPVVVGLSRKWFLGRLLAASDARAAAPPLPGLDPPLGDAATPVPADDRLEASVATAVWALSRGRADGAGPRRRPHGAGRRLLAAASPTEASWSAA